MADWDEGKPGDSDIVSQFPANERAARAAAKSNFGVDHHEANDANVGRHEVIQVIDNAGDPTGTAGLVKVWNNAGALKYREGTDAVRTPVNTARTVGTGTGLTGGGDLSADRTIAADLASQAEAEAGSNNTKLMTPLRSAQAITALAPKKLVQSVYTQSGAVVSGSTAMGTGDSIPQQTEGTELMTLAITPQFSDSILMIEFVGYIGHGDAYVTVALFKDSAANAVAGTLINSGAANNATACILRHNMVAGGTSSTTFKIRAGAAGGATVTLNGVGGSRRLGGVMASSLRITELRP